MMGRAEYDYGWVEWLRLRSSSRVTVSVYG